MIPQSAATVFRVSNIEAALKQYQEVFGFVEVFRFGDYAGLKRGEMSLHLTGSSLYDKPVGGAAVYVFCDEVDGYFADLKKKGVSVKSEPRNHPYGMRDFVVADLDGNLLSFGCESKPA